MTAASPPTSPSCSSDVDMRPVSAVEGHEFTAPRSSPEGDMFLSSRCSLVLRERRRWHFWAIPRSIHAVQGIVLEHRSLRRLHSSQVYDGRCLLIFGIIAKILTSVRVLVRRGASRVEFSRPPPMRGLKIRLRDQDRSCGNSC